MMRQMPITHTAEKPFASPVKKFIDFLQRYHVDVILWLTLAALALAIPSANAADVEGKQDSMQVGSPVPPTLVQLQEIPSKAKEMIEGDVSLPLDIRKEAIKEAALSYGARGGLASRTYQIRRELDSRASYMDKVFDFRQLLIAAPSGLIIEPPIISESLNALIIEGDGQQAAVSDSIYNINAQARIVSAARNWRQYLERDWGVVEEPPEILRPKDKEERKYWRELVEQGWREGFSQADEIFEQDLNVMVADYNGMIRYRQLLTQGMVSPPFALQVDRGVTGGGNLMRVGDRAVRITGPSQLITGHDQWQPANR